MSTEVVTAFVVAGLWALAGASSISRPGLRLGNYFVLTCWLLAGSTAGAAALGLAIDETWPATWLVAGVAALVLGARVRTSQRAATDASNEGRAALAVLGVGVFSAAGISVAALVAREVLDWPSRAGLVPVVGLGCVAGLTSLVNVFAPGHGRRLAIWVLGAVGTAATVSGLTVSFVQALIGDFGEGRIGPSEALVAAAVAGLLTVVTVPGLVTWLNQRVSDGRGDERTALLRLESVIDRRLPIGETLLQTCELLRSSLQLDAAEVWTATDDEVGLSASDPHRATAGVALTPNARRVAAGAGGSTDGDWVQMWLPGVIDTDRDAVAVAVTYAGDFQGLMIAYGASNPGDASSMLDEVSHRLGPVMHSASLDASLSESVRTLRKREEALRASRERLVATADHERARIERNLHDGVQQHLVALGVNLQLAQGLIRSDPERAEEIVGELTANARSAVEELRSLARGIFPKTLEDEGIGPALDEIADDRVKVTTSGARRFPREIETAVYFACNEAITNALKHADADAVSVNLVGGDEALVFEVVDNGGGFDTSDHDSTHGLANMADRVGAVDGQLTITSDASGTRVLGTIPLVD